jgi:carbon-monoxide dehydrogenase small subunit
MAAVALGPRPSIDDIRVGLAGNLCRCTGYSAIYRSIEAAAKRGTRRARGDS